MKRWLEYISKPGRTRKRKEALFAKRCEKRQNNGQRGKKKGEKMYARHIDGENMK